MNKNNDVPTPQHNMVFKDKIILYLCDWNKQFFLLKNPPSSTDTLITKWFFLPLRDH